MSKVLLKILTNVTVIWIHVDNFGNTIWSHPHFVERFGHATGAWRDHNLLCKVSCQADTSQNISFDFIDFSIFSFFLQLNLDKIYANNLVWTLCMGNCRFAVDAWRL